MVIDEASKDLLERLGRNISNRRCSLEISEKSLADSLGCSVEELAEIEAGQIMTTVGDLQAICASLEIHPRDLFS